MRKYRTLDVDQHKPQQLEMWIRLLWIHHLALVQALDRCDCNFVIAPIAWETAPLHSERFAGRMEIVEALLTVTCDALCSRLHMGRI
jgi:hypothetical protein